jgi:hypothetical protein
MERNTVTGSKRSSNAAITREAPQIKNNCPRSTRAVAAEYIYLSSSAVLILEHERKRKRLIKASLINQYCYAVLRLKSEIMITRAISPTKPFVPSSEIKPIRFATIPSKNVAVLPKITCTSTPTAMKINIRSIKPHAHPLIVSSAFFIIRTPFSDPACCGLN